MQLQRMLKIGKGQSAKDCGIVGFYAFLLASRFLLHPYR
jgi:hypothetical protein